MVLSGEISPSRAGNFPYKRSIGRAAPPLVGLSEKAIESISN
jgi:hypothetical protein